MFIYTHFTQTPVIINKSQFQLNSLGFSTTEKIIQFENFYFFISTRKNEKKMENIKYDNKKIFGEKEIELTGKIAGPLQKKF